MGEYILRVYVPGRDAFVENNLESVSKHDALQEAERYMKTLSNLSIGKENIKAEVISVNTSSTKLEFNQQTKQLSEVK